MSAAHGANPQVMKFAMAGILILLLALIYDVLGWDFLSRNINLTSKPDISNYVNEDGIPGNVLYKVTSVSDGGTIHIDMDGIDESVKLIGINVPISGSQCYGKESLERVSDLLLHEKVRIETDNTQGTRDTYGRILAYVYQEDDQMINRKLIAEGYAYEYTYLAPYKYQHEFRSVQNLAKASLRGLWAEDSCHGELMMSN